MEVGPASSVAYLLNTKNNFRQRDVGDEKRLTRLGGDEADYSGIGFWLAELGNDVGIEQPAAHRLASRTLDLIVRRSNFTSARGDAARAATISRPVTGR